MELGLDLIEPSLQRPPRSSSSSPDLERHNPNAVAQVIRTLLQFSTRTYPHILSGSARRDEPIDPAAYDCASFPTMGV